MIRKVFQSEMETFRHPLLMQDLVKQLMMFAGSKAEGGGVRVESKVKKKTQKNPTNQNPPAQS